MTDTELARHLCVRCQEPLGAGSSWRWVRWDRTARWVGRSRTGGKVEAFPVEKVHRKAACSAQSR